MWGQVTGWVCEPYKVHELGKVTGSASVPARMTGWYPRRRGGLRPGALSLHAPGLSAVWTAPQWNDMIRPEKGGAMGLIRKSLFVATAGAVAPRSTKQRVALQTLAAIQGATPEQIERTGTRRGGITGRAGAMPAPARQTRVGKVRFTADELAYMREHAARSA